MAGIGFELRKLLQQRSYSGLLRAYFYAGVIGSGPWVLSILGILLIGIFSLGTVVPDVLISQFQVTVTYLILTSLILTSFVQLGFTRFVADRLFVKDEAAVLPNFLGLLLAAIVVSVALALPAVVFLFPQQSALYRFLLLLGLPTMSAIWIATIFLTGLKHYRAIVLNYAIGYGASTLFALWFRYFLSMEGLLLGFILGQFILFSGMLWLVVRHYRSSRLVAFDIWKRGQMYPSLLITGFLLNLAIWVDKLMFWFHPNVGQEVIGFFRASVIYDLPIFLAYLSVIPGMAVFLVRIETDFVEYYDKLFSAVREGATLNHIERMRNHLVYYAQRGLFDIAKIQGMATLAMFVLSENLLRWLGISTLYLPLLYVDLVGAGIQVVLLGIFNILFYLDERRAVLRLSLILLVSNVVLTAMTLKLGAVWFGYGFAGAMALTTLCGLAMLSYEFDRLEYKTFMLQ